MGFLEYLVDLDHFDLLAYFSNIPVTPSGKQQVQTRAAQRDPQALMYERIPSPNPAQSFLNSRLGFCVSDITSADLLRDGLDPLCVEVMSGKKKKTTTWTTTINK